jgi:uncharacterized protein HemX
VTAPTTETAPRPASKGGGLSKKAGPLPVWGWIVVVAAGGLAYWYYRKQNAAAAATSSTAASGGSTDTATSGDISDLESQNAQIYSAIQDLQGDASTEATDETREEKQLKTIRKDVKDEDKAASSKPGTGTAGKDTGTVKAAPAKKGTTGSSGVSAKKKK